MKKECAMAICDLPDEEENYCKNYCWIYNKDAIEQVYKYLDENR